MNPLVIFSDDIEQVDWSERGAIKNEFGPKAACLTTLPKKWTPPFAIVSAAVFANGGNTGADLLTLGPDVVSKLAILARVTGRIYVRSSVIGESIWDRGTYESKIVEFSESDFEQRLVNAVTEVLQSAPGKKCGLVIQCHVQELTRGEFGNLLRVSKTRDQWELCTYSNDGSAIRDRLNSQRDEAADSNRELEIRAGVDKERAFGAIGAWLNNEFFRGQSQRVTCEWIANRENLYLVQIDEEEEDTFGVNPFQLRVIPAHQPKIAVGKYLQHAEGAALTTWDKLKVLDDLSEPEAKHRPTLFYVPLSALPVEEHPSVIDELSSDFENLIGPDNIVVRTSVRTTSDKILNLPRTDGMTPRSAAEWCFKTRGELNANPTGDDPGELAFVAHRFIGARAAAWARADPNEPIVEIHSLWGLPDALQYCPYDIWEVHLPTEVATEHPVYKSNMMIARENGRWEHVRIKNELGRNLSLGRKEALEIARRSSLIAQKIGEPCHIMWFVGCVDSNGSTFNLPWYWTKAHDADRNSDRANYHVIRISSPSDLNSVRNTPAAKSKLALELMPTDLDLMRDTNFIRSVGVKARELGVPVLLAGSTLAHAYFTLRKECNVVARGEKEHSRIRRSANFGKIVRDKIPGRIAKRKELDITRQVPQELAKNYLISKLLEEALEVRAAQTVDDKRIELADLFEVIRALIHAEGMKVEEIIAAADKKKEKSGGFDQRLVLIQTAIPPKNRSATAESETLVQPLARKLASDTYELPFTFFGFMEPDQPRSLSFEGAGIHLVLTLKGDRIQLQVVQKAEQLELPLDLTVITDDEEN
jgi:predicted house-cleaning noncanonical NTP pyrophosphatase (MazG superfamily)